MTQTVSTAALASAGVLLAVQQVPVLQRLHHCLAAAATMVPLGLVGWAVGATSLASGRRGRARDVALAGVLLAATLHACGLSNRFGGRRTPAGADHIRVVMLNVEYGLADTASLLARARRADADVIVVVEHHPRTHADLALLADEYPHRIGRATTDAEGTLVLSRTPLTLQGYVGEVYDNYVVSTRVRGVDWTVAAVHPYPPVTSAAAWVEDARRVAALVAPFVADNLVVIGDFNATIDQLTMGEFTRLGLRNAALQTGQGWQATWPMKVSVAPFAALDHALTSPTVVANQLDVFTVRGTDHKGLCVTASVQPGPRALPAPAQAGTRIDIMAAV